MRTELLHGLLSWILPHESPESLQMMNYRIRLIETEEGWAVSCLDLPGCHSQGKDREEAIASIREAIADWMMVEMEDSGIKRTETMEIAV